MFGLGIGEIVLILVVLMVVFGASRLPALGKGLGEGLRGFKDGLKGDAEAPKLEADEDPKELDEAKGE